MNELLLVVGALIFILGTLFGVSIMSIITHMKFRDGIWFSKNIKNKKEK